MASKMDLSWYKSFNDNQIAYGDRTPQKKREDILLKYPARALAYSNEVGEALRPLSNGLATAMWIPALMYIGADIFDKYSRGEKDDYQDPSKKKGITQAVFQTLASIFMPTAAVKVGQGIISNVYKKMPGSGIDARAEMEIIEELLQKGHITSKDNVKEPLEALLTAAGKEAKESSIGRKIYLKVLGWFTGAQEPLQYLRKTCNTEEGKAKVVKFIEDNVKKFDDVKANNPKNLEKELQKLVNKMEAKPRWIKVGAGLLALSLAAKPIDAFVEHIVVGKIVHPLLYGKDAHKKENAHKV